MFLRSVSTNHTKTKSDPMKFSFLIINCLLVLSQQTTNQSHNLQPLAKIAHSCQDSLIRSVESTMTIANKNITPIKVSPINVKVENKYIDESQETKHSEDDETAPFGLQTMYKLQLQITPVKGSARVHRNKKSTDRLPSDIMEDLVSTMGSLNLTSSPSSSSEAVPTSGKPVSGKPESEIPISGTPLGLMWRIIRGINVRRSARLAK